jgi:parallel beta-helix repeat protein
MKMPSIIPMLRYGALVACFVAIALLAELRAGDVLEITGDTVLDPQKTYGAIEVKASNVTIDGRGAWLLGPATNKLGGSPSDFQGVAIRAKGVSNVRLRNVNARGWETGLKVEDGASWLVEQCNFSDNFHDPSFGWGENGRRGGIVFEHVRLSTIKHCRANRVWDACVLVNSPENTVEDNDFSHTSNTALTLWASSRNHVRRNDLSYGLRNSPGEVHARDSSCVLIQSGSNENHLEHNNCTHGGDGIFIRVLNGWVSTGNVLEGNDCSYANNNGFEAWSPRNVYRHNKANHCSYGFWLGASDQTTLDGNEASYNGDPQGFHNSPHLPEGGHAGIVFMFGPSSHTVARNNTCVGNNGAGIAAIGDVDSRGKKWKAHHWIIEQNTVRQNRWGLFLQHAEWFDLAGNAISDNSEGDIKENGDVSELIIHKEDFRNGAPPSAVLKAPAVAIVGLPVMFDASQSKQPSGTHTRFRWHLGDGPLAEGARIEHVYKLPGFYRVGLTVTSGALSDLAWRDLYVTEPVDEIGTEGAVNATRWSFIDPQSRVIFQSDRDIRIVGNSSLQVVVNPYGGERVSLRFPAATDLQIPLTGKSKVVFWIKFINEHVPAWQNANPLITLYESARKHVRLEPRQDLLSNPPYNEARDGWTYLSVPLKGDLGWKREGDDIATVNFLTIGFDSWGTPPLLIWLDGLAIE